MRTHYPRTPHLPWSPGASADDLRTGDLSGLRGREVVVTEKLDGENTTLYRDGLHARSLDSAHHPSRTWVKALQGRIGPTVPQGWRICGENLFARHSIAYRELAGYFYGFSVWDAQDRCLDWDLTVRWLGERGVPVPRVLWRGVLDDRAVRALRALRLDLDHQEGYVVRTADGFPRAEFGQRVAKWVRPGHVQTSTHWMHAPVVPNGLGPSAALWSVRSGGPVVAEELLAALGADLVGDPAAARAAAERLDLLSRTGDARLAGVLAALLHGAHRGRLAGRLAGALGVGAARRVADLVGLHANLLLPYPDQDRRGGLGRLALAADLGVLHAVAAAVADGPAGSAEAVEQVEWSALLAEEAGLLGPDPFAELRTGLRAELAGLDPAAADRCWAQAKEAFALGRIGSAAEAVPATWRWRDGGFPRLVQLVGPSGSGKSSFARRFAGSARYLALDDLRAARGDRADQRANGEVLREGLDRLDAALAAGGTAVWDATSLTPHQRAQAQAVARRRDALTTQVVALVGEPELLRRNAVREHPVPAEVLTEQLRRYDPPYPGQAHRTWYLDAAGEVSDTADTLSDLSLPEVGA
ncbi:RNA ligase family protein [Kitasatospora viridis]|uniref:Putative kinase n=1 Tax=Kitasatospora viridis TaxID=281105 RepID=A0A561UN54_9ACTN|nr:RNA ligase family protein [Kitasatospora viridis]TWG00790.1 putative kinase [Kitasatospora viridis]